MDLRQRSHQPELMDDPDLPEADYEACLADLARVNRVTRTHAPVLAWLDRAVHPGETISVLDVAYGQGDLLRAIASWAARNGVAVRLEGIDLNPRSAPAASSRGGDIAYRTGDVFDFTPEGTPDYVVTSQFAHHLPDNGVIRLIGWMERQARKGWFIADLHRTAYAYYGFRLLCRAAGWHRIVRHDGTISIARSFRRHQWRHYLQAAGVDAVITAHPPSRLCVARLK